MNLAALKSPQYRLYLIGNIFGMNANWILRLVIGWLAWELTESASFVGLVSFLVYAPVLLGGPIFGVITDRVELRLAMFVTNFTVFLLAILMLVVFATGSMTQTFLAIYAFVIGTAFSAYQPIRLSLGPRLVRPERISSVVGLGALNFNISRLTGPALAGMLIAAYGITTTLFIVVLLYVPFLAMLAVLKARDKTHQTEIQPFWESFKAGFVYVAQNSLVRATIIVAGLYSLVIRASLEVLPIFAGGVFDKGAAGLGALTAAAGVGAIVASFIQVGARPLRKDHIPRRALYATLLGAVFTILLGWTDSWSVTVFTIAVLGFAGTVVGVNLQSAVQMQLDDSIRGRVMSLWMTVAVGGTALGALGLGLLIEFVGVHISLVGLGVISLITFSVLLTRIRH